MSRLGLTGVSYTASLAPGYDFVGEFVAFNPVTGEREWVYRPASGTPMTASALATAGGIVFGGTADRQFFALHDETGELLWIHEQDNTPVEEREPGKGDTHANTILFDNGYIYYAEGDGNAGVKLKLSEGGTSIEEIWRNPEFDSYMGGIVKLGDYIYGCGSLKPGLLNINADTGEIGSRDGRAIPAGAEELLGRVPCRYLHVRETPRRSKKGGSRPEAQGKRSKEMIKAGQKAPAFTLPNQDGKKVSLKDFSGKWLILYFYPKDNTSG